MDAGRILRIRLVLLSLVLAMSFLAFRWIMGHAAASPARKYLGEFPKRIGGWVGTDAPIPNPVLEKLGVDDHLMRVYGNEESGFLLYIGYYSSQKGTKTIHSPKHCYPGAGWQKLESSIVQVRVADKNGTAKTIPVNRYLLEKGGERELVYYWYQSAAFVDADEISAVARRFRNAMFMNRTDGALVRISTRIRNARSVERAENRDLIPLIYSFLWEYIPE